MTLALASTGRPACPHRSRRSPPAGPDTARARRTRPIRMARETSGRHALGRQPAEVHREYDDQQLAKPEARHGVADQNGAGPRTDRPRGALVVAAWMPTRMPAGMPTAYPASASSRVRGARSMSALSTALLEAEREAEVAAQQGGEVMIQAQPERVVQVIARLDCGAERRGHRGTRRRWPAPDRRAPVAARRRSRRSRRTAAASHRRAGSPCSGARIQ